MTCRFVVHNLEKLSRMFPTSITLFAIASLIPFMTKAFSTVSLHTNYLKASKQSSEKLSMHIMGQSTAPSNADQIQETNRQPKDVVITGEAALKRLSENTNYVAAPMSDKDQFLRWAREITKRKLLTDKEFKERVKVRELKKFHTVAIKSLEDALKDSKDTYLLNPNSVLINELERAISNCQQATANMEKFLFISPSKENDSEEIPISSDVMFEKVADIDEDTIDVGIVLEDLVPVGIKLDEKEVVEEEIPLPDKQAVRRLHILEIYPVKKRELLKNQEDREALLISTPEYYNYQNCLSALMNFYEDIGLNDAEKNVLNVQKGAGKGRNTRGRSFEDTADSVITDHLLPRLARAHNCEAKDLMIVRNLKLGMASNKGSTAELDSVICVRTHRPERMDALKPRGTFCKVLAVVEVKRNPDDVGNAFLGYQRSLAWLAGKKNLYDPLDWQTKSYPKGHFNERPFLHDLNGEVIIFSTESFEELRLNEVKLKLPSELMSFMISEDTRSLNFDSNEPALQDRNVPKNIPENVPKNIPDSCDSDKNIPVDLGTQNLEEINIVDSSSPSTYGLFVQDLYFVTKNGSMDSIHSKAMSWALNKISCETEFDNDLNNEDAVENLRLRVEARYPHLMATYDLIQMYSTCSLADQLFVVTEESK